MEKSFPLTKAWWMRYKHNLSHYDMGMEAITVVVQMTKNAENT